MDKNEIYIIYGKDIEAMTIRLAEEADLAGLIGDRNKLIGLKPNLVTAKPASEGATTHPEIAAGLIAYLKKNSFNNIVILEGAWAGGNTQEAFKVCGYKKIAEQTGVKLIDTKRDKSKMIDCKGMQLEICESALAVDFLINLPVMKGHCQTRITCALKNNKGLIPDREKRRFHSLGLTKPIAHLNTVIRNDFILVDGICGDLDFEEGGNPLYAGRLIAAQDPVLCDAWVAAQMGYAISDVPYIALAEKLGIGSANLNAAKVRELNKSHAASSDAKKSVSRKVRQYAPSGRARSEIDYTGGHSAAFMYTQYINEDNACSACYASLIYALSRIERAKLERMSEKICVGQGFKGKRGNIGIGNCCAGFAETCTGCPPSGAEVLGVLNKVNVEEQ